jgi:protein-S-isoprenylcysteine O-methyltransferase Ste14
MRRRDERAAVVHEGHLACAYSRLLHNWSARAVTILDQAKLPSGADWLGSRTYDWLARATLILVFTAMASVNFNGAYLAVTGWADQPLDYKVLYIASRISNALFLALAAATAVTRLRPVRKAAGIQPRVSALLGSFLISSLVLLPPAQVPPIWLAVSSALILVGASLSFVVLRWLGKSFSIMAEARRLITKGPYAIVRHPLYVCEELAVLGVLIQVISPLAVVIAIAHGLLQFRRMLNEEKVLRATFPEYEDYAARTPRLVPRFRN